MDENTVRLNRIEEKLDKVSDAIVSLARMEERMITLFKRMDSYDTQQISLGDRVSKIEVSQATNNGSTGWVEKVIMVIVAGAISFAVFAGK